MATRNNGKPKQMSEANESESEPSIVPLKLPSGRTLNISKSSFITRYRNNNTDKQEVKSSEVKKDDKKRSRSPSREEEDDITDDQDEQTAKDLCSTYSITPLLTVMTKPTDAILIMPADCMVTKIKQSN